MKVFLLILMFLASPGFSMGQVKAFKHIFKKADSLVTTYWGEENFKKYIRLDSGYSQYCVLHDNWDSTSDFNKPLHFKPNVFRFRYNIIHPLFENIEAKFPIQFYLDSTGEVISGFGLDGFAKFGNLDSIKMISQDSAIAIAKKAGFPKGKKEWVETLVWNEHTLDDSKGFYSWIIKSYFDKPFRQGCIRYDFEAIYISIKNGDVLGIMYDPKSLKELRALPE